MVAFFLICSSNSWRQSLERSRRRSHPLKWQSKGRQFTLNNSQWICYINVQDTTAVSLFQAFQCLGGSGKNGEQRIGKGFGRWCLWSSFLSPIPSLPLSPSLLPRPYPALISFYSLFTVLFPNYPSASAECCYLATLSKRGRVVAGDTTVTSRLTRFGCRMPMALNYRIVLNSLLWF